MSDEMQLPIWMVILVGRLTIELELARQEAESLRVQEPVQP